MLSPGFHLLLIYAEGVLRVKKPVQDGLEAIIREKALSLGFDDVGFCSAAPFEDWRQKAYESLVARVCYDPHALMADARCIVVAIRRYAAFGPWPEGTAPVANYYVSSTVGFDKAKELAQCLSDRGYQALPNPRIPAKQAALRAGLGVQGINTQFCHDSLGMLVSIHLVLTDAPVATEDATRAECQKCGLCIAACPTGAVYEGGFDYSKCLRHHMASGEVMPVAYRELMGVRLTGCTDCQHVCPNAAVRIEQVPDELAWACGISGLLDGNAEQMAKLAEYIGSNFARPGRIRQQAAICAGNTGNRAYVPQLAAMLSVGDTVLRSHAAWALGRLGGPEARAALDDALLKERDENVRKEIEDALRR